MRSKWIKEGGIFLKAPKIVGGILQEDAFIRASTKGAPWQPCSWGPSKCSSEQTEKDCVDSPSSLGEKVQKALTYSRLGRPSFMWEVKSHQLAFCLREIIERANWSLTPFCWSQQVWQSALWPLSKTCILLFWRYNACSCLVAALPCEYYKCAVER